MSRKNSFRGIGLLLVVALVSSFSWQPWVGAVVNPPEAHQRTGTLFCPSEKDILHLVSDLGDPEPICRARAYHRLQEIGDPVLDLLPRFWDLAVGGSQGPARIAGLGKLVSDHQDKNGIRRKLVNRLEFEVVTKRIWQIPAPGKEEDVALAVKSQTMVQIMR